LTHSHADGLTFIVLNVSTALLEHDLIITACAAATNSRISHWLCNVNYRDKDRPWPFDAPRNSICIMDLPALRTIPFLHGIDSPACRRVHVGTGMVSPARPTWLAYGQRGEQAVARRDRHQDGQRDSGTDELKTQCCQNRGV